MTRTQPPIPRRYRTLVIVPCKNESESVGTLVRRLSRALPECDVLVVDDGSTDQTLWCIPPQAHVLSLPFNLGIGGAMQTGYRYAAMHGYDVAVQVDGDGQHRPGEVRRLVHTLIRHGADLVVGSRFLGVGRYRQTLGRRLGGLTLNGAIRVLTGLRVTDSTSGFRAASRSAILAFAHWYPEDYPEPEVLLLLKRSGFRIVETEVTMRQRRGGRTSISMLRGVYYMIKVVLCLVLDTLRDPWPEGKAPRSAPAVEPAGPASPGLAGSKPLAPGVTSQPHPSATARVKTVFKPEYEKAG